MHSTSFERSNVMLELELVNIDFFQGRPLSCCDMVVKSRYSWQSRKLNSSLWAIWVNTDTGKPNTKSAQPRSPNTTSIWRQQRHLSGSYPLMSHLQFFDNKWFSHFKYKTRPCTLCRYLLGVCFPLYTVLRSLKPRDLKSQFFLYSPQSFWKSIN